MSGVEVLDGVQGGPSDCCGFSGVRVCCDGSCPERVVGALLGVAVVESCELEV